MAYEPKTKPSFTPGRKWRVALDVVVRSFVVLAVVGMLNYLGSRHFYRSYLSEQARHELSPRTLSLLRSFTNTVKVTMYYDRQDEHYPAIASLLTEFHNVNPRIQITAIDPLRDAGAAAKMKQAYVEDLGNATNRNFIIFDCEGGGRQFVPVGELISVETRRIEGEGQYHFERKAVAFLGEPAFANALLAVTSPRAFKAYFLQGHSENVANSSDPYGYLKFAGILNQNYIRPGLLYLTSTNVVPPDCDLLVIAGPTVKLDDSELEKIDRYLNQGGRVLAMFNGLHRGPVGLESLMDKWGVVVSDGGVRDLSSSYDNEGLQPIVADFGKKPHPTVNSLVNVGMHLVFPRAVAAKPVKTRSADTPNVQEIAFTSDNGKLELAPNVVRRLPLMVAVERGVVPGVINARGTTRMIVIGDCSLLANEWIERSGNREFAHAVANWLVDRPHLLEGIGPRPIREYRIAIDRQQLRNLSWIMLGGIPGGILMLGGLMWLSRRK